MTTLKLNDNFIVELRNNINNYLVTIFPKDIVKIISDYDYDCYYYNLEGTSYSFQYPYTSLFCMRILPDRRIVSDHYDEIQDKSNIKVWDPLTDKTITLHDHLDTVLCFAVLPDGRLVSGSKDTTIKIWNLQTEKCEHTFEGYPNNPDGHSSLINSIDVLYDNQTDVLSDVRQPLWSTHNQKDHRIVSASHDCTIKIWNLHTGKCDITISETVKSWYYKIASLPDGRILSSSCGSCELKIWNAQNGTCDMILVENYYIHKKLFTSSHKNTITYIGYISDSFSTYRVISGASDYTIKIWNVKTGKCEMTLNHSHRVEYIAVLPDERVISGLAANRLLNVWNLKTGKCDSVLTDDKNIKNSSYDWIKYVHVLSDGRIVSITNDRLIRIWGQ